MNKLGALFFWLLAPALAVLVAAPVFIVHVAAHLLMDRMRRDEKRGATSIDSRVERKTRPTWKSPMLRELTSSRS